mgnify:CR=1 FL=1
MLEIDPTGLTVHVVLPLVGVLEHGGTAGVVELVDAHFLDLIDRIDAQSFWASSSAGQTVRIPAEHTIDLAALHGLVTRNHILGVTGQQVAVMRQAVGERRTVEEHEFVLAVIAGRTAFNGLLESVVLLPIIKDGFFQLRETGVRRYIGALLTAAAFGYTLFSLTVSLVGSCYLSSYEDDGRNVCWTPPPRYHLVCRTFKYTCDRLYVRLFGPSRRV